MQLLQMGGSGAQYGTYLGVLCILGGIVVLYIGTGLPLPSCPTRLITDPASRHSALLPRTKDPPHGSIPS